MPSRTDDEKQIVSYLLGELAGEEQARVEERFLRDVEFREIIRSVEDDLVDEYVRGELQPRERALFEERFNPLPHRRRKVEFASALTHMLDERGAQVAPVAPPRAATARGWSSFINSLRAPGWALGLTASTAAVLLLVGGLWLITQRSRPTPRPDEQLRAERQAETPRPQASQQQTPDANAPAPTRTPEPPTNGLSPRAPGEESAARAAREGRREGSARQPPSGRAAVAAFALLPGVAREGDAARELALPREAREVRLRLYLERGDEYASYRVRVSTAGGVAVWQGGGLRARTTAAGRSVVLSLRADALAPGDYEVALAGRGAAGRSEDIGYYYFTVVRK